MTEEILDILRVHCDGTDAEIQTAFDEAENSGFVVDGYSNNPSELIGFISGYIIGRADGIITEKNKK